MENNIKMDLKEIGFEGVDWTHVDENRDQCRVHLIRIVNLVRAVRLLAHQGDCAPCGSLMYGRKTVHSGQVPRSSPAV
jgi:hypothetical protein